MRQTEVSFLGFLLKLWHKVVVFIRLFIRFIVSAEADLTLLV